MIGSATGALAVPLAAIIANTWLTTRRGLVSGLLTASNASGQLIFLPLLAWIATTYSWRWTAGAVVIAAGRPVIPLALIFLRHSPDQVGILPYGATQAQPPPPPRVIRSAAPSRRCESPRRGATSSCSCRVLVCGATTNGLVGTHLIAACADHGFTEVQGAAMLAAIGVFDIVGTITSGWLTDRYDPRWLLFWYYALRGISLLGLNAALSSAGLGLGVLRGLQRPRLGRDRPADDRAVPQDRRGRARRRLCSRGSSARTSSARRSRPGARASPALWLGTYEPAFIIAGVMGVAAAMVSLVIGRRIVRPLAT